MLNFTPKTLFKRLAAMKIGMGDELPISKASAMYIPLFMKVAQRLFYLLIGFAAGNVRLPFDAFPAGIALISSAPRHLGYVYAGAMLSLLSAGNNAVLYALLYTACFAVKIIFSRREAGELVRRDEPPKLHLLLSGAAQMLAGTALLIIEGGNATSVLRVLIMVVAGLLFAFIMSGLESNSEIAFAGAAYIVIYAIQGVTVISLTPAIILSGAITLAVSRICGPAKGALIGVACAIATGQSILVGASALLGLASGLFFPVSDALAITAGAVCCIAYIITGSSLAEAQLLVPDILFACVAFLPVRLFADKFELMSAKDKQETEQVQENTTYMPTRGIIATSLPSRRLDNLSAAFGELNETFADLSEKLKRPPVSALKSEIERVIGDACEICPLKEECESREYAQDIATAFECIDLLTKGTRLSASNLPSRLSMRCARCEEVCQNINTAYNLAVAETIKTDKTTLLAKWYSLIGKLLGNASKDGHDDINFCREQSEHIYSALESEELPVANVVVMGSRVRNVYLFDACERMKQMTSDEVKALVEEITGCPLSAPEYTEEEDGTTIRFSSSNRIAVERAYSAHSKSGDISGDSVIFFDVRDDHYSYALICDGMGSGKQAALASRLACMLTEKLLSAGSKKEMTIELLNTVLLSTGEECFTTIDLLEIDLISQEASFIKAGAAPAFIIRRGGIFKIQSASVPVGIVNNINAELTSFKFEVGDVVIMLSDGVISTYEEGAWLLEIAERDGAKLSPQELADTIAKSAAGRNLRKDDVTCAVLAIKSA